MNISDHLKNSFSTPVEERQKSKRSLNRSTNDIKRKQYQDPRASMNNSDDIKMSKSISNPVPYNNIRNMPNGRNKLPMPQRKMQ